MSQHQVKDLEDFLVEAELQHYYDNFKDDLKVRILLSQKLKPQYNVQDVCSSG